ncbi:MAG: efflux RND transporter periplasmic adaptor subunit [Opitutus sp.]|nr:efflux RND transporter periplasmic adaptor subunit [Opitutus sp.]
MFLSAMSAKKNNGRVLLKLGLALVGLAGLGVALFLGFQNTARVEAVKRGAAVDAVTGSARVDADGGLRELPSEVAGKVMWCEAIDSGRAFKVGEKLVQLDTADLDRRIAETERNYKAAKERARLILENNPERKVAQDALDNARRLRDRGEASEEQVRAYERAVAAIDTKLKVTEFDDKKAEVDFNAAMEEMQLQREKMTILAPADGTIEGAFTWKGALIGAGKIVATWYASPRIVTVKISEESFGKVKVGQVTRLRLLTYGTQYFDAVVSKLHPTADDAQRFTVFLDVKVDAARLFPNSTGEATITVDQRPNQIMIRRRALVDNDRVYVVKNGRVQLRKVEVGYVALNVVEIRQGLEVGEQIIVDRLDEFRAGQRVRAEVMK